MNIHGARRAGRRRRKACIGWIWAAACGLQGQGRGHVAWLPRAACFYLLSVIVQTFVVPGGRSDSDTEDDDAEYYRQEVGQEPDPGKSYCEQLVA